jgi:hypothetical protein
MYLVVKAKTDTASRSRRLSLTEIRGLVVTAAQLCQCFLFNAFLFLWVANYFSSPYNQIS